MVSPLPIFLALDDPDWDLGHVRRMAAQIAGVKLGMAFFYRLGPVGVQAIQELGVPLFLDVKVHDIPNTAAAAVRALTALGAAYITLHAAGGMDMLRAARQAADEEAAAVLHPACHLGLRRGRRGDHLVEPHRKRRRPLHGPRRRARRRRACWGALRSLGH